MNYSKGSHQTTEKGSNLEPNHVKSQIYKDILDRYENLSFFEKEEVIKWIRPNWSKIPMPFRSKKLD